MRKSTASTLADQLKLHRQTRERTDLTPAQLKVLKDLDMARTKENWVLRMGTHATTLNNLIQKGFAETRWQNSDGRSDRITPKGRSALKPE